MKDELSARNARAEMEAAKQQSEKTFGTEQRLPRRYRFYDKIKERVPLRTLDIFITVVIVLLIVALVVGIATAKPPQ